MANNGQFTCFSCCPPYKSFFRDKKKPKNERHFELRYLLVGTKWNLYEIKRVPNTIRLVGTNNNLMFFCFVFLMWPCVLCSGSDRWPTSRLDNNLLHCSNCRPNNRPECDAVRCGGWSDSACPPVPPEVRRRTLTPSTSPLPLLQVNSNNNITHATKGDREKVGGRLVLLSVVTHATSSTTISFFIRIHSTVDNDAVGWMLSARGRGETGELLLIFIRGWCNNWR